MLKDKLEKVKNELTKTDNKNSKKKIENIVIGILILLITVIAINAILSDKDEEETVVNEIENNNVNFQASNTDLETRLENILSKIEGVGKVEVLINYSETEQVVAMYNENKKETATEEQDESGGTRVIKENDVQKDVIYQEKDGEKDGHVLQKQEDDPHHDKGGNERAQRDQPHLGCKMHGRCKICFYVVLRDIDKHIPPLFAESAPVWPHDAPGNCL